jgi:hypothetical protein
MFLEVHSQCYVILFQVTLNVVFVAFQDTLNVVFAVFQVTLNVVFVVFQVTLNVVFVVFQVILNLMQALGAKTVCWELLQSLTVDNWRVREEILSLCM